MTVSDFRLLFWIKLYDNIKAVGVFRTQVSRFQKVKNKNFAQKILPARSLYCCTVNLYILHEFRISLCLEQTNKQTNDKKPPSWKKIQKLFTLIYTFHVAPIIFVYICTVLLYNLHEFRISLCLEQTNEPTKPTMRFYSHRLEYGQTAE